MVKTKPTKHKGENTFKFQTFSERLSAVNVDVVHRLDSKRNTVPEETETFFYECLEKWTDLNCTEGYGIFCYKLGRDVQSLGQLLLHEEKITALLLEHIHKDNVLFLEPLLELVVAVAKDLQSNFYPKFEDFFNRLVELLQSRDPQIVEWTFTALAYLYKSLWRLLVKDVSKVYELLLPLLAADKPEHIQLFASESFAFIGKKVSDPSTFINLVFSKLQERPADRLGVGQLLFHLVKGVTNQFHSRLETFLPIYFKSLGKFEGVSIQDEAGFQAVEHCFLLMARHTSTAHCSRVWKLLLGAISSSPKPGVIGPLLLLHQWISYKEGELVNDGSVLAELLISLVKNKELTEQEQTWTSKATAALMMSSKILLPLELTSRLANLVYTCHWKPQIVLNFTLAVVSHGLFESHLLPLYTIFCHSLGQLGRPEHAQVLGNLARVVTIKRPQPKSGYDIDSSKIYPIEFSFAARKTSGGKNVPDIIRSILESSLELMITEDFPLYVNALVCLPHVRPFDAAQGTALLKKVITGAAQLVKSIESGEPKVKRKKIVRPPDFAEKLGLVLSLAMLAIRHFSTDLKEILPWDMVKFAFLNESTSKNLFYLRAADFYLTTLYETEEADFFTLEMLTQLYDTIGENVYSPYREVRLLSLHIFSLFTPPMPTPPENIHPSPVFQICLRAEMVPATVTEQREKMKHLQNLEADRVIHSLPLGGHFNKVPLQYLLSQLFINFRPLWEPLLVFIESHAFNMEPSQFWSVYLPFVERLRRWQPEETCDPSTEVEYLNLGTTPDRLDVLNVRSLVWKGLSKFGDVTEKQNDIIVPLFLDFWNNEYSVKDGSSAQTQDLTCTPETRVKEKGNILQLLSSYLSVLASFKNPQNMVREPEVNAILLRLLSHRSDEIQKLALDCLFNYEYSYLNPYKENLYRLLDDKSFRTELTSFSVDDENSTIQADHRPGLTPIMIRMLYGKMMHKAGLGSTGKENTKHRQSVILRFIAGFTDSEIDVFLDLAFQLFSGFVETENIYQHVQRVMADADPTKALPLKRIEGALNLMGTIFSKLGNLMKSTLPKLLNILLSTFAHVTGLLSHRDRCEAKHKNQFKALRTLCMQRITQFFTKFEQYPWSPPEIEAVFHVCVWPQLEFLSDQALNGPTPLMRLFQVWSENNRYFVLLGKRHPKRSELNVLSPLLDLLICGKANTSVSSFIMEMVEKLVTTADYGGTDDYHRDDNEEIVMIRPDFCFEVPPITIEDDPSTRPNFGTLLLMSHLSPILSYLRKVLSHGLNGRDLNILMRISEYVTDPHLSGELARLIAPAIKNMATRSRNTSTVEDKLTRYLDTLTNLMKSAEKPQQYVGILAPLFGSIEGGLARSSLCNVLQVICERDPAQGPLGKLVSSLNSLDKQRVDQPDFNLRLATHKEINAILEKDYPSLEWAALVLYNSFHSVRMEEDISLKDNASFTLQQMTSAFGRWKFGKVLLNDHFLPQLRILIRSSNETIRHEGVSILGQTVLHCGALNAAISSMKRLRKTGDAETDFFENSRHLQTHRRSRALLRLVGYLKQDKKAMNAETITHFLLPLATCYLFNEEYAKHNHLVDAALECLQAIACCLSWSNYEKLLRFYLANMTKQYEYQKQAVKAVVVILNAFHFDLKNSTYKSFYRFKAENEPITIETIVKAPTDDATEVEKEDEVDPVLPEMEPEKEEGDKSTTDVETATRIHSTISQQLLPALHSILTSRSKRELQHKSNQQDRLPEENEILRVPIALALVNLLKNLPAGALDRSLPGMLSKVITFLKSRGNVVRDTARDTLIQMVVSLGPQCLSAVMDAANPILQRGFQVHVYIYTLHAILAKLGELGQLKAGSLDEVVAPILELCKKELYGDTADEKEVVQITNKLKEAKGVKAYDTLQILSKYVSQSHLLQLILPMKEILSSTKSFKMAQKVEECLMNIATGLSFNDGLAVEPLLIFVHGVVSLSIPQLKLPAPKIVEDPFTTASGRPMRTDSLILAPTPKRKVAAAAQPLVAGLSKTAYVTNSHIIVEFGLLILSLLLKREKCHENSSAAVLPMLDPIIPIVYNKLNDPHSKTIALSLRCICVLLRVPLPSISEYAPKISTSIFTILHKYAGSTAGENYEMVQTAFKAISILVRHVTTHTIDEDQLRVLLTYAEQALCDPKQQSIAFGVLKAILKRKLTLEELPEVMLRVSELSIKAEAVPVRVQSRKVVLQYLIEYPLGKKVMRYLEFFLGQLDFEKEAGRLSAIEFLVSVFQSFPKNTLSQQCSLFLVTMSPHLINDTSSSCVKALAAALRTLIQQLNTPVASNLFDICLTWLKSANVAHKRLAVQLCGIFAAAEGACFEFRLKELLPELIKVMDKMHSELEDRDGDLLLIQAHYTIIKIAQHCPNGLQNVDNIELTDELWNKVIHHLVHPHLWIRTLSARLVGTLMGWHKVDELASYVSNPADRTRTYFFCPDVSSRLRSLASDSVAQLQSEQLDNQLADQVIKNLVFIAKVANRIPAVDEEKELGVKPPTVPWLTGKLRREINAEVALRPKTPIKRVTVFKWMAAVAVDLNQVRGKEGLLPNLKFFVPPLTREVNDDGAPEEVKNLAQEVSDLIKGMVGTEAFSEVVVTASRNLAVRRRDRQAVRKAETVTKPDKTAQIRIKKQFAKRVAKKVKIAKLKGARPKLKDLAFRK